MAKRDLTITRADKAFNAGEYKIVGHKLDADYCQNFMLDESTCVNKCDTCHGLLLILESRK